MTISVGRKKTRFIRVRRALLAAPLALACGLLTSHSSALADEYPSKPIRLVVPFGPGGATDLAARALSSTIGEFLNQGVIVVNVAGAGGSVGFSRVKDSEPDGYTMMMTAIGANMLRPAMIEKLPYKYDDLTYIARTQINPNVLVVKQDAKWQSLDELMADIKENAGSFKYATSGVGNIQHLGAAILLKEFGLSNDAAVPVHYDSGSAAMLGLLQGEVQFVHGNLASFAGALSGGKARGLAVTTPERVAGFDDIPTYTELGYPGIKVVGWRGVAGPAGIPQEVVDLWESAVKQATETKSWNNLIGKLGDTPGYLSASEYDDFLDEEFVQYRGLFTDLGLLQK